MSKNKNNRPKEIRSLKGPSRKLELIVEDGKRYYREEDYKKAIDKEKLPSSQVKRPRKTDPVDSSLFPCDSGLLSILSAFISIYA